MCNFDTLKLQIKIDRYIDFIVLKHFKSSMSLGDELLNFNLKKNQFIGISKCWIKQLDLESFQIELTFSSNVLEEECLEGINIKTYNKVWKSINENLFSNLLTIKEFKNAKVIRCDVFLDIELPPCKIDLLFSSISNIPFPDKFPKYLIGCRKKGRTLYLENKRKDLKEDIKIYEKDLQMKSKMKNIYELINVIPKNLLRIELSISGMKNIGEYFDFTELSTNFKFYRLLTRTASPISKYFEKITEIPKRFKNVSNEVETITICMDTDLERKDHLLQLLKMYKFDTNKVKQHLLVNGVSNQTFNRRFKNILDSIFAELISKPSEFHQLIHKIKRIENNNNFTSH